MIVTSLATDSVDLKISEKNVLRAVFEKEVLVNFHSETRNVCMLHGSDHNALQYVGVCHCGTCNSTNTFQKNELLITNQQEYTCAPSALLPSR